MITPYSILLLGAFLVSAVSIAFIQIRSRKLKTPPYYSKPRGKKSAGIVYAFTLAFAPWAKESARRHLLSYLAGIFYHLAIFLMLAVLLISTFTSSFPQPLGFSLAGAFGFGAVCGLGLLLKRIILRKMRRISVPDDYFANFLVTFCLATSTVAVNYQSAVPAMQLTGAILLLYAPLGKLRHMLFLLTSRWYWGEYFGFRGVRPAPIGVRDDNDE